MKKILTMFVAAAVSQCALATGAEDLVKQGNRWSVVQYACEPEVSELGLKYVIDGTQEFNGVVCAQLWCQYETESEPTLTHLLYADGDKVFFADPASGQFRLMYDFGAQPGDMLTAAYPLTEHNATEYRCATVDLVVTAIEMQNCGGVDHRVLRLQNADGNLPATSDYWIDGVGHSKGVAENARFAWVGGDGQLVEMTDADGKKVYVSSASVIAVEGDSDAPECYYDINGVSVSNPVAGRCYISVKAGKAQKIKF